MYFIRYSHINKCKVQYVKRNWFYTVLWGGKWSLSHAIPGYLGIVGNVVWNFTIEQFFIQLCCNDIFTWKWVYYCWTQFETKLKIFVFTNIYTILTILMSFIRLPRTCMFYVLIKNFVLKVGVDTRLYSKCCSGFLCTKLNSMLLDLFFQVCLMSKIWQKWGCWRSWAWQWKWRRSVLKPCSRSFRSVLMTWRRSSLMVQPMALFCR